MLQNYKKNKYVILIYCIINVLLFIIYTETHTINAFQENLIDY